jgi:site-specific DNA-methyltransferase (adenine-specific)
MRQIVRASLPLGEGVVLDPFMGGGSTIAAASAVGYQSIGIELDPIFFNTAKNAIPALSSFSVSEAARVMRTNGIVHLNGKGQTNGVLQF